MVLSRGELQAKGCVVENAFASAFTLWRVLLQLLKWGRLAL